MEKFARNLDWNLLHTFMVIVQEQGLTPAAQRLFLTQPAVSLALKRLESAVGIKLIERGSGTLCTTPAGETLFKEACKIYASITRLPISLEKSPNAVSGKITIATISQVVTDEFDEALCIFFKSYPKTSLSIVTMTTADVLRAVELGRVTMGICDGVIPDTFIKQLIRQEDFGIFCGREHSLFGKRKLLLSDLRGEPFISFTADVLGGQHMGDVTALRAKASIGQSIRGQSSNVSEVCRMIRIGMGIGFLPLHLAKPYLTSGSLWRLPPYDDVPSADIYQIYNPATNLNSAEGQFIDQLIQSSL